MNGSKLASLLLGLYSCTATANVIQYFTGISYSNPAELFKVKKDEFIIGGNLAYAVLKFDGSQLNLNTMRYDSGKSYSKTTPFLPYGRIAKRLGDSLVFGVDVTEPFNSNLNWGNDTFTRYAVTQNYLTDVDVSPRLAYQATKSLSLGLGVNFNFLHNNEVNFALPSSPTTYEILRSPTSGFGVGADVGLSYAFNQFNFLGITYYSRIKQNTRGTSTFGNNANTNLSFNFYMPATTIVNYTHIFSPKWLAAAQLFLTEWDVNQYVHFNNTAAPTPPGPDFTFTMAFDKSLAGSAIIRYQLLEKMGLTLIGMIDDGPEQDEYRTIVFPSDTQYFVGLMADFHPSAMTTIEFLYGYGWEKTSIQNHITLGPVNMPFTTGKVNIGANIIDLKLKIQG